MPNLIKPECPFCNASSENIKVTNTRRMSYGEYRTFKCRKCEKKFSSKRKLVYRPLTVKSEEVTLLEILGNEMAFLLRTAYVDGLTYQQGNQVDDLIRRWEKLKAKLHPPSQQENKGNVGLK